MSSPAYGEPLELDIRPSRQVASLLLAIHLTAAVVISQLPMPLMSRLIIFAAILTSLAWNGVMFWRRTPKRLLWSREQGWRITDRRGVTHDLDLLPQAYLGNWMMVAHFQTSRGRRRAVILAHDSCSADSLRRLRVMLRYGTPKH
ncbi:MAG TPA: protein YgfX [Gammaproteobacteria bacterium]|nr:protein YgfX [Gammaproteobacteria bacterium]